MISIFDKGKPTKEGKLAPSTTPKANIEFEQYLSDIQHGTWEIEVLGYRKGQIKKLELPGVTPSGTFSYRSAKHLDTHSGFIGIDIDAKDQIEGTDFKQLRADLEKDPYTYALHSSVSGNGGIVVYVKIDPLKHLESFMGLEKYYLDQYRIIIDSSGKDVSRFRFVSFDPALYKNGKSKTFRAYIKKAQIEPQRHSFIFTENDLDHIFQQIENKWIDLTDNYHDWYRIGGALQKHYGGQKGRDLFHFVSQKSAKYDADAVDSLYNILEKRNADKVANIGTFLWLCKNAGIEINTKRTEYAKRIATARRKSVGTSGGAKSEADAKSSAIKTLEMEDISGPDVHEIVEQVFALPAGDLEAKSDDVLADLKAFLTNFDIKFNEITRNYEMNGEPMNDRDYNSIYIKAVEQVDDKITKDRLFSLIDSEHTPSYNPFTDFINKHRHIQPTGNFEALCRAIKYRQTIEDNGEEKEVNDYLEVFLKKWMLGVISSMHGTYSILILVFTGGQRAGKTKFFRGLLPDDLLPFYAESKLDEGKDSEILMTKKLIILDDEFGGKSKSDAKRLKELSSKQWFNIRRPFGRTSEDLRRLAVLAGTSNDEEVLNDPTGNRRIIPVNVLDIDHEAMEEIDKVALWMEIYHEWKADPEKFILTKEEIEILNRCTERNEEVTIEEDMFLSYFQKPTEGGFSEFLTTTDIKNIIETNHPNVRLIVKKLGQIIQKHGFKRTEQRVNGIKQKGYFVLRVK